MTGRSREWERLPAEVKDAIKSVQKEIPIPIGRLAKSFGLEVKVHTLDVGISGMIFPAERSYKILVNKHEPVYRQRFTLAHELAHYLLHRDMIGSGISDNVLYRSQLSDVLEAEANRLASDLLMPPEQVKKIKSELGTARLADTVSLLANRFAVSEEAMRIRLGMK